MNVRPYVKDPNEVLDYRWDWGTLRLVTGETIQTSLFIISPSGTLVEDSSSNDGTSATVWLSGGEIGDVYRVTNRITTSEGRTYDWTIIIVVRSR